MYANVNLHQKKLQNMAILKKLEAAQLRSTLLLLATTRPHYQQTMYTKNRRLKSPSYLRD